jgi:hypothetical protein
MGLVRKGACLVGLGLALVTAGCGSSGSGTTAGSTGAGGEHAVQTPVESRGTKGENPSVEAATTAHLSSGDCKALGALAERDGASVNVYLDAGFAAAQRYHNRIEETVQFDGENPAGLPQPVPHVGDKAAYNADAGWIPALGSLLAVRGNRWLTVTISIRGHADRRLRAEAAALARAGFKLSAVG